MLLHVFLCCFMAATPARELTRDALALKSGLPRLWGEPQNPGLFGDHTAQLSGPLGLSFVPGAIEGPTEFLPLPLELLQCTVQRKL